MLSSVWSAEALTKVNRHGLIGELWEANEAKIANQLHALIKLRY